MPGSPQSPFPVFLERLSRWGISFSLSTTSPQLESFHFFARLPQELQDLIWSFACVNDYAEPEAHHFTIEDDRFFYQEETSPNGAIQTWSDTRPVHGLVPVLNDGGSGLDRGLWCACMASRQALFRQWKEWYIPNQCRNLCPHTVSIVKVPWGLGIPGEAVPIVMRQNDLIICHAPNLAKAKGHELSRALTPLGPESPMRTRHLAMEYDNSWLDRPPPPWRDIILERSPLGGLARQTQNLREQHNVTLCFIEHNLEMADGYTYQDCVRDCTVFRAKGKRYIMINPLDHWRRWRTLRTGNTGSIMCTGALRLWSNFNLWTMSQAVWDAGGLLTPGSQLRQSVGVLVCVKDEMIRAGMDTRPKQDEPKVLGGEHVITFGDPLP